MARKAVQSPPAPSKSKTPPSKVRTVTTAAVTGKSAKSVKPLNAKPAAKPQTAADVAVAPKAASKTAPKATPKAKPAAAPLREMRHNTRGKMQDGSPHPIDIHVGSRVRLRRSIVKMSQQELARAVGITFQQVQKYERGTNRISISRMYEMANALGVPATFFLEDMPQQFVSASKNKGFAEEAQAMFDADPLTKRETRALIRAYYQIAEPKLRKQILDLAKMLANASDKDE